MMPQDAVNKMRYSAGMMRCREVRCGVMRQDAVRCDAVKVRHDAVRYFAVVWGYNDGAQIDAMR